MKSYPDRPYRMGITLRTALWSWGVALVTLAVFAAMIIPRQKQFFRENLESKARGVAVSLRDVAASSVVNEDFSSVVEHCKVILTDDPALDYLVITKNDGFSLFNERPLKNKLPTWRIETDIDLEWRPSAREPSSGIGRMPLFNRRVFHYTQPFDYSGIQWGWIHVGLSLEAYDRSVASLYHQTLVLGIGCVLLSLLASAHYARWQVRPILDLRNIVQRVADGDLTARAEPRRGDELGALASSVNTMTEALLRRDRILESVRLAAQRFLGTTDWTTVIEEVLERIGEAAEVGRIRVFQNQSDEQNSVLFLRRFEWVATDVQESGAGEVALASIAPGPEFASWIESLQRGEVLTVRCRELNRAQRQALESQGFKSILIIPIKIESDLWGAVTLADFSVERNWTAAERDSFRAAADMLGATISRQRAQDALIEAKVTLEKRVRERTRELLEQAQAKEKAHAELAEAQQRLMDVSRQAGMAEVATGVLHNVGNVLNSVNVSCTLVLDRARQSEINHLPELVEMLSAADGHLVDFLARDPKGRQVPSYLCSLFPVLIEDHHLILKELSSLRDKVDHIKEIVAMQQDYARISGVIDTLSITQLVEDALKLNAGALARHGVTVLRQYDPVPLVATDKHKVLQILLNLVRNAKYACDESGRESKTLTLRVYRSRLDRVAVQVIDNGVGIPPENLLKIFSHGFTTRKDGHGFGLHSGALAAKELGGSLMAESAGPGRGATFTLELPCSSGVSP
ncbi:MAG TPA: HAMP domain-containing protein [Verrucomicrobiota bacterium]|nr:HAMP domain-containing protein [Verrucomicrobiota bacterium]